MPTAVLQPQTPCTSSGDYSRAALALWPRISPREIERCGDDPRRLAAVVARRTSFPVRIILAMLEQGVRREGEPSFYFG